MPRKRYLSIYYTHSTCNSVSKCEPVKVLLVDLTASATGEMGRATTTFYKRLASMIAEKRGTAYAVTLNWIRCRLSFALLRASIMAIRGARSSRHHPATESPIDLQLAEGHLD